MAQQQTSAKGCKKKGRNKNRCEAYTASGRPVLNKLKRILHSNGALVALNWAEAHSSFGALRRMATLKPAAFARAQRHEEFRKFIKQGEK